MPHWLAGGSGLVGGMAGNRRDRRAPGERLGMKTAPQEAAALAAEVRLAEAAKAARLRALRLAKEAADRAATPVPVPRRHGAATARPARGKTAK